MLCSVHVSDDLRMCNRIWWIFGHYSPNFPDFLSKIPYWSFRFQTFGPSLVGLAEYLSTFPQYQRSHIVLSEAILQTTLIWGHLIDYFDMKPCYELDVVCECDDVKIYISPPENPFLKFFHTSITTIDCWKNHTMIFKKTIKIKLQVCLNYYVFSEIVIIKKKLPRFLDQQY